MHLAAVIGLRNQYVQAEALAQAATVEVFLHGEGGAEQADTLQTGLHDRRGSRVGDMQQGQRAGRLDLSNELVHGVGADQQQVGATGLQPLCGIDHLVAQGIPVAVVLQLLDAGEIQRPHQQLRRMRAAQPRAYLFVDEAVVLRRTLPAHATDQAKRLHACLRAGEAPLQHNRGQDVQLWVDPSQQLPTGLIGVIMGYDRQRAGRWANAVAAARRWMWQPCRRATGACCGSSC
ncbi:hypothetical protein BN1263460119 [Stenotrophomonas indicatrix]|nr:hypothetical protein BN1263460119 [Stenotrophomonas indicatrix]